MNKIVCSSARFPVYTVPISPFFFILSDCPTFLFHEHNWNSDKIRPNPDYGGSLICVRSPHPKQFKRISPSHSILTRESAHVFWQEENSTVTGSLCTSLTGLGETCWSPVAHCFSDLRKINLTEILIIFTWSAAFWTSLSTHKSRYPVILGLRRHQTGVLLTL